MGVSEASLLKMVEYLAKVPDIIVGKPLNDTVTPGDELTTVIKLLSPEVIVKFYLHLEKIKTFNPELEVKFENGDTSLNYQAVMNQLEQGTYVPKGETEDVIGALKLIDSFETEVISINAHTTINKVTTSKHIAWDHDHFK